MKFKKDETQKSFIDEDAWAKALADKGDYYLIQFGHNDMKGKGTERETDPRRLMRQIFVDISGCASHWSRAGGGDVIVEKKL